MAETKVKIDEYDYFALAEQKKNDGDLIGCLTILRGIEEEGTKNLEVYATMGEIFFDMEIYSLSQEYWFKYLAGSNRQDVKLRAYSALGATYCMTGENYLMGYYYDLEFSLNPMVEQQYDNVLFDYLEYNKEEYPDFYVTYPVEKLSSKNLYVSALDLMNSGNLSEAISRFSLISPDSEFYDDAVFRTALYLKETGKSDEEITDYLRSKYYLATNKGKIAILLCETLPKTQTEELKGYLDVASGSNLDDPGDYFYVAKLNAEMGRMSEAMLALDKAFDINPYDVKCIFLYGVIKYNLGLIEDAREYFKVGYDICRDQINLFYYRLTFDKDAKEIYPTLPFSYVLPEKEAARRITDIAVLIAGSKTRLKKRDVDELIALAEYGLDFSINLTGDMIKNFIVYGPNKLRKFFIMKLLSQSVRSIDRMQIVEALTLIGYDKRIDVVIDNVFMKIRLYRAVFNGEGGKVFSEAYAFAVSRLFPFRKDLSGVRDSAYSIYYLLEGKGLLKKVKDKNALAAVIAEESSTKPADPETVERLFKTSRQNIDDIKALFED